MKGWLRFTDNGTLLVKLIVANFEYENIAQTIDIIQTNGKYIEKITEIIVILAYTYNCCWNGRIVSEQIEVFENSIIPFGASMVSRN